jgi:hypothetical protein
VLHRGNRPICHGHQATPNAPDRRRTGPLVTPERVKTGADAAAKAGLPVEYREAKNYGHTLLAGAKLDEALEWLIAHNRE